MGKVKKGTIFKIFIVTLLVILSTIGIVLSNYKEEQIELLLLKDFGFRETIPKIPHIITQVFCY